MLVSAPKPSRSPVAYGCYDIEVVATDNAWEYLQHKEFKAPSTYKDAAKIENYIAAARLKAADKFPLHWTTGRIIAISVAWYTTWQELINIDSFIGDDEAKNIRDFFACVKASAPSSLCGAYSSAYDRPFIMARAMVQNIGLVNHFRIQKNAITDVLEIFGGKHADQTAPLRDIARAFGIDGKQGSGKDIAIWHQQKDWDRIAGYNRQDCLLVGEVMTRYLKEFA